MHASTVPPLIPESCPGVPQCSSAARNHANGLGTHDYWLRQDGDRSVSREGLVNSMFMELLNGSLTTL